jgi:hypothetical protein
MPFDEVDRLAAELDVVIARFQDRFLTREGD